MEAGALNSANKLKFVFLLYKLIFLCYHLYMTSTAMLPGKREQARLVSTQAANQENITEHRKMSRDDYGRIVVDVYSMLNDRETPFDLDMFLDNAENSFSKTRDLRSKEYIVVSVAEVLGQSITRADNPGDVEGYERFKAKLQGYTPQQRAFLRMCITDSEWAPAVDKQWGIEQRVNSMPRGAQLIAILA